MTPSDSFATLTGTNLSDVSSLLGSTLSRQCLPIFYNETPIRAIVHRVGRNSCTTVHRLFGEDTVRPFYVTVACSYCISSNLKARQL